MTSQVDQTLSSGTFLSNSTAQNVGEDLKALMEHASVVERGIIALTARADALKQKLSSAKALDEQQFFASRLEQVERELLQANEALRRKKADLSEAQKEIRSKDTTCSTLAGEVERLTAHLRQMSQIYGFELPDDTEEESMSLLHGHDSQTAARQENAVLHVEMTSDQQQRSEIENVSCQRPSTGQGICHSDTARSSATTSLLSESSEWSSGTSSVSSSLPSTSIESTQSSRNPPASGLRDPTAPVESFNHITKQQLIDRMLKLQDDLRKVAVINRKWKQDYDHMKSIMQKENDRLAGIIAQREFERKQNKVSQTAAAVSQETIDKLSQERSTAQRQAEHAETEANKLRRDLKECQHQLDELLNQRVQEGQAVEVLKQQLRGALSELEDHQTRMGNQRRENDELKQQVQFLQEKVVAIKARVQDAMADPEPRITGDHPVVPPRDKIPKKPQTLRIEPKGKNAVLGPPEMFKQSSKSGNHDKLRRKVNEQCNTATVRKHQDE